jgi:hypothetical protein
METAFCLGIDIFKNTPKMPRATIAGTASVSIIVKSITASTL